MQRGLIFNIQRYSIQDGPGVRTTVFFKGCPLRCWWCHNPEGIAVEPEVVWIESRCRRCGECLRVCPRASPDGPIARPPAECLRCGACVEVCPSGARQQVGRWMTAAEVLAEILKDRVFYEESRGGATFSGGEPLMQADFLKTLLDACRSQGIHTAVDTSGYAPLCDLLDVARLADLFLYDLKLLDDRSHLEHTGVEAKMIVENLRALGQADARLWIRIPVIPGTTDRPEALEAAAALVAAVPSVERVCLLPYHRTALHKSMRLGGVPKRPLAVEPPSAAALERAADVFRARGLTVQIGG